jgi:nucleoside-diphosphate-sugar epimerase
METILLTGATVHAGFQALVLALQAGYSVRAVLRNLTKADGILTSQPIKDLTLGSRLSCVEIADLATEGAFDEVLKGVTFVARPYRFNGRNRRRFKSPLHRAFGPRDAQLSEIGQQIH